MTRHTIIAEYRNGRAVAGFRQAQRRSGASLDGAIVAAVVVMSLALTALLFF